MLGKIVKAEILFSRQCPLACPYCAMKTETVNSRSVDEWKQGIAQLKNLGCEFIAFYGAEPLVEFEKLKRVISACEENFRIDTTIITSGAVPNFEGKLVELYRWGARSLSMSYDPLPMDNSTAHKSLLALQTLSKWKEWPGTRDAAAITTLNAKNFREFPDMVRRMDSHGIWSFFDFIHTDRGQAGTKCANVPSELMFSSGDFPDLLLMLEEVIQLKERGYKCHTSRHFIEIVSEMIHAGDLYNWTCSKQDPSWITIDCDGKVYPCDDYSGKDMDFDMTTISEQWEDFSDQTNLSVIQQDCRCCWNTHIDSHGIASGKVNIEEYVHGRK